MGGREILGQRGGDDRTTSQLNLLSDFLRETLDPNPPCHKREDEEEEKKEGNWKKQLRV